MEVVVEKVTMGCAALQVLTIYRINTIRPKFHPKIQLRAINAIQGDVGGKVNILRGDNIGHCEKNVNMNMCLILNRYRDRAL
jgi:hypothetical protein